MLIHIILWFLGASALGWKAGEEGLWPIAVINAGVGWAAITFLDVELELRLLVPEGMRMIITAAYWSGLSLGFGVARSKG